MCFQVHKFYANRIPKLAVNGILAVVLHAGSLGVLISLHLWLLETIYLNTSIVWALKFLAGKTAAGIAMCMFSLLPSTQAWSRGLLGWLRAQVGGTDAAALALMSPTVS